MELVRSRLCEYVHYATREPAILGIVVVGLDPEFLHRVRIWKYVAGIAQARNINSAIQIVIDGTGAAIHAAIDQRALLGISKNNAVVVSLYPRRQVQERIQVPIYDRQVLNFSVF